MSVRVRKDDIQSLLIQLFSSDRFQTPVLVTVKSEVQILQKEKRKGRIVFILKPT